MVAPSNAKVGLSTASVYPESTAAAFAIAAALGYDGVEVMVGTDPSSQNADDLARLSDEHEVAILAIHAPCLVISQRVWTSDPWEKLRRGRAAAERLGAQTVVVHPPFRWQRDYARTFRRGLDSMSNETDVRFAVENMFPVLLRGRPISPYDPSWEVTTGEPHRAYTLDLSHTAASGSSPLALLDAMGDRLAHVHVGDGFGTGRDEHLIPGRGNQPVSAVLERIAAAGFAGHVIIEANTRRAVDRAEREADLAEALAFCRLHLVR